MNSVMIGEGTGRIMNMKIICDEGVWQRCMHVWGVCYGGMWEFVYHAYVLQGGGGGDETVETGMKLMRSLQSGSEASLSMGSGNGTTRGIEAEVSAAYMFWSAEDASSTAMDYRKGDVEEGVVNQAGGGGGRKERSNSLVRLKRVCSSEGIVPRMKKVAKQSMAEMDMFRREGGTSSRREYNEGAA